MARKPQISTADFIKGWVKAYRTEVTIEDLAKQMDRTVSYLKQRKSVINAKLIKEGYNPLPELQQSTTFDDLEQMGLLTRAGE